MPKTGSINSGTGLEDIVRPFELGARLGCNTNKLEAWQFFKFYFNETLKVGTNENGSACGRWLSIGFALW
jgi:hypothetical protein